MHNTVFTLIKMKRTYNVNVFFYTCFRLLSELLEGKMYNEAETQRILRSFPQNPIAAQIAYKFVRSNWRAIVARYFATLSACEQLFVGERLTYVSAR